MTDLTKEQTETLRLVYAAFGRKAVKVRKIPRMTGAVHVVAEVPSGRAEMTLHPCGQLADMRYTQRLFIGDDNAV